MTVFQQLRREEEAAGVHVGPHAGSQSPGQVGAEIGRREEAALKAVCLDPVDRLDRPLGLILQRHTPGQGWDKRDDRQQADSGSRPEGLPAQERLAKHATKKAVAADNQSGRHQPLAGRGPRSHASTLLDGREVHAPGALLSNAIAEVVKPADQYCQMRRAQHQHDEDPVQETAHGQIGEHG